MSSRKEVKVRRPSLFWLLTETGRAVTELGINYTYQWWNQPKAKGDSHPVLVLPGFMASAQSTLVLRKFIDKIGYTAYDWDIGRNYGKVEYLDQLLEQVDALYNKHQQKVSLIGWSLGGVYARQLAKERPDIIRQIIMMGTPFQAIRDANHAVWIHKLINFGKEEQPVDEDFLASIPAPAPVPSTSIYSKQDGVVPWAACLETEEGLYRQNIQVRSSHLGFGVNPAVYAIIADRLQLTRQNWQHFQHNGKLQNLLFYPSA
ncbi:MAG: alpha/beta hydrolase [Bacteroidota bacterium]